MRDEVAGSLSALLAEGRSVLVCGAEGIGRSHLLETVGARLGVSVVHGGETVEGVPFVPFARVLAEVGNDGSDAAAVYVDVPADLRRRGSALVVDDVDRLDRASVVLLAQSIRSGVPVLASVRDPGLVPAPLTTLLTRTMALEPLADAAVLGVAAAVAGGPLEVASAVQLLRRASGNPGLAAALLRQAERHGALVHGDAGVRVTSFAPDAELLTLAGHDAAGLTEPTAAVLDIAVVAGGVPVTAIGPDLTAELHGRNLIAVADDVVEPAGPLVSDLVLHDLGELGVRQVAADALGLPLGEDARQRLEVLAGIRTGAAAVASTAGWLVASRRYQECRWLTGGRTEPDVLVQRAEALLGVGERAAALTLLDGASHSDDPEVLVAVARGWIHALRGQIAEDRALEDRVRGVLPRLGEAASSSLIDALARRRLLLGNGMQVARGGDLVTAALGAALDGEAERARRLAPAARAAHLARPLALDEELEVLAYFLSLVYDGGLREGYLIAQVRYQVAFEHALPTVGLWAYNQAKMAMHAHRVELAFFWAEQMRRHLAESDPLGLHAPAAALYATAAARHGRLGEAEGVVAAIAAEDMALPRVAGGVARVRAERLLRERDRVGAAAVVAEASRIAQDGGELYTAAYLADEAFMLRPDEEIRERVESFRGHSLLLATCADRAAALLAGDVSALARTAESLVELVQPGRAVDALRHAARIASAGLRGAEEARRHRRRATEIEREHGVGAWPGVPASSDALTPAERAVAERAAARERSREIAAALEISVRTVDNHLAAVYRKLGVSGRDDLAEALEE